MERDYYIFPLIIPCEDIIHIRGEAEYMKHRESGSECQIV